MSMRLGHVSLWWRTACVHGHLIALVFLLLGIFFVAAPETVWQIKHMFTVQNGEPTNFAIWEIRISGVLLLIVAVVAVAAQLSGVE